MRFAGAECATLRRLTAAPLVGTRARTFNILSLRVCAGPRCPPRLDVPHTCQIYTGALRRNADGPAWPALQALQAFKAFQAFQVGSFGP